MLFRSAKRALSPRQGAHGLCVLRRATGAPAGGDASAVVAILMYKAVNKAAPSKGATRVATLVIKRPSATPLQGRRQRGTHSEPLQRRPPGTKRECPMRPDSLAVWDPPTWPPGGVRWGASTHLLPSTENDLQVFSQNFPVLVLPGILRSPRLGQIFQICLVGLILGM